MKKSILSAVCIEIVVGAAIFGIMWVVAHNIAIVALIAAAMWWNLTHAII